MKRSRLASLCMGLAFSCGLVGGALAIGCGRGGAKNTSLSDASPPAAASGNRVPALLAAEHRRDSASVSLDDLSSRELAVRRHAARSLARIADERAAELLAKSLSDEDPEVVAWSAYGLGYGCKGREPATVRILVTRAASLFAAPAGPARIDPVEAITDALARCGTNEAERTLRGWLDLSGARAESAALALGKLASRHKRLDDASIVALLDAATRPAQPVGAALFAFSRLAGLGESVQARLHEVAIETLGRPGSGRAFAVRALGRAGTRAATKLGEITTTSSFTISERADAVRELGKLGPGAQPALAAALKKLVENSEPLDDAHLVSPAWGPLITALEALQPGNKEARPTLERLAALSVPEKASAAFVRRTVALRCRAAVLLSDAFGDARVTRCDPTTNGRIGSLAVLSLLERSKITGARQRHWQTLAAADDAVVRQAALRLLSSHPEISDPQAVLASALAAKDDGTVASAAEVIAAYPERGSERTARAVRAPDAGTDGARDPQPIKPHPNVVQALTKAFGAARGPDAVETRTALVDAVGALGLLSLKNHVEVDCTSDNPTLREHAEKALRLLGERERRCKSYSPDKRTPRELDAPLAALTRVELSTDVGELRLELDPELSPVAVTRIVELVRAGFFNGIVVHRVVPGFVVQFGDPGGDGYGGAGRPSLRCETSPVRFDALRIGIALAGRDTGSSQIFVTLGPFPHLDGDYALIGRAEPGFERLAQGDLIRQARVLP